MKLDESLMRKTLKEEYDKRINFFLNEKITLTTKYGANVIADAVGLKVFDKAGFRYTFAGIVKQGDSGEEFAKLILPEEPLGNEKGSGASPLFEKEELDSDSLGFISRKSKGKRDIEFDVNSPGAFSHYQDNEKKLDPQDVVLPIIRKSKENDSFKSKYILVPMGEFEERFSIN